jgi:hypothetical protein
VAVKTWQYPWQYGWQSASAYTCRMATDDQVRALFENMMVFGADGREWEVSLHTQAPLGDFSRVIYFRITRDGAPVHRGEVGLMLGHDPEYIAVQIKETARLIIDGELRVTESRMIL